MIPRILTGNEVVVVEAVGFAVSLCSRLIFGIMNVKYENGLLKFTDTKLHAYIIMNLFVVSTHLLNI